MCYSNAHSKKKGGNNMSKKKDKKLQDYEKNLKRYSKAHLAVELNDIKRKRIINNTLQILVDAMLLGGEVYLINELIEFLGNIGIEMNVENKLLAGLSIWLSFSSLIAVFRISPHSLTNAKVLSNSWLISFISFTPFLLSFTT